jgi:hypothetical protein
VCGNSASAAAAAAVVVGSQQRLQLLSALLQLAAELVALAVVDFVCSSELL